VDTRNSAKFSLLSGLRNGANRVAEAIEDKALVWNKNSKLIKAARNRDPQKVQKLLDAKADPNYSRAVDWGKETPLETAIHGKSLDCVKKIIDAKADLTGSVAFAVYTSDTDRTPQILKTLIEAKADTESSVQNLNCLGEEADYSPLMHAISDYPELQIVKQLIKAKADISFQSKSEKDPLDLCAERNEHERQAVQRREILKKLLASSSGPFVANWYGSSLINSFREKGRILDLWNIAIRNMDQRSFHTYVFLLGIIGRMTEEEKLVMHSKKDTPKSYEEKLHKYHYEAMRKLCIREIAAAIDKAIEKKLVPVLIDLIADYSESSTLGNESSTSIWRYCNRKEVSTVPLQELRFFKHHEIDEVFAKPQEFLIRSPKP